MAITKVTDSLVNFDSLEILTSASDTGVDLTLNGNKSSNGAVASIIFENNTDSVAMIRASRVGGNNDAADLQFFTQATGGSNSERARILSTGGITFNGDTAATNALDDYEEGTWTPVLTGSSSAGSFTVSSQAGIYTKIGSMVNVQFLIIVTGVSSQPSGNINVTGLPFAFSRSGGTSYMPMGVIGYNDVFSVEINKAYANGSQLTLVPNGITQSNSNWSSVTLSTGYFSGNIWYPA